MSDIANGDTDRTLRAGFSGRSRVDPCHNGGIVNLSWLKKAYQGKKVASAASMMPVAASALSIIGMPPSRLR
ncbi:hypothetical protein D3C71_1785840 [compost metagenome]